MKKTTLIVAVLAASLLAGAAGFGGAWLWRGRTTPAMAGRAGGPPAGLAPGAMPPGAAARGGARGDMVAGKVTALDDESFTVETPDGGSSTVYYSDSTDFTKITDADAKEASVGTTVTVTGDKTSGGVTAKRVTIQPKD